MPRGMPTERQKLRWRGCLLRLCLFATLLLCLQLSVRLGRSWLSAVPSSVRQHLGKESFQEQLGQVGAALHPGGYIARSRHIATNARSDVRSSLVRVTPRNRPLLARDTNGRPPVRWHIDLQPWAGCTPSMDDEAWRFLQYITTAQISCGHKKGNAVRDNCSSGEEPWTICLDEQFHLATRMRGRQCRLYSLGLGNRKNQFEVSMANEGCEVHRFDPTIRSAHVQEGHNLWYHRLSIGWRDPNPAISRHHQHSTAQKLGTILNKFGHQKIDLLKADLESAEWKILENLVLENVVDQFGQLVIKLHLHWPGFEVSGNDSSVIRYWYSLLKELEHKDFRIFHTYKDLSKPQVFLKRNILNVSSCYTLSWINTKWQL